MWDLNSSPRDWTWAPCIESEVLTTGPPGKSQEQIFKNKLYHNITTEL